MSGDRADGFKVRSGPRAGALVAYDEVLSHVLHERDALIARERRARATDQKTLSLLLLAQTRICNDLEEWLRTQRDAWDQRGRQRSALPNRS